MASRGVNKVLLIGFLGQDPEIRYMPGGSAVATLSMATSESWRDKQSGELKEKTEWHRVVVFGKPAEIAGEYLRKGSQVYIEGQLRTHKWFDEKNGVDRFSTEVVVSLQGTMQMLGSRHQETDSGQLAQGGRGQSAHADAVPEPQPLSGAEGNGPVMDFNDDIPFIGLGYGVGKPAVYAL